MEVLIMNPALWISIVGAIAALGGAGITALVTRKRDSSETGLKALTLLVEKQDKDNAKLEAKVEGLVSRLDAVESEIEDLRKKYRILAEKYSTAMAFIHALRVRLGLAGVPTSEMPEIPPLIAVDMLPEETSRAG